MDPTIISTNVREDQIGNSTGSNLRSLNSEDWTFATASMSSIVSVDTRSEFKIDPVLAGEMVNGVMAVTVAALLAIWRRRHAASSDPRL